jgi:putative dehydrogenase
MSDKQAVGIIGLGAIGLPLARNLLEAGFPVVGCNRSGAPAFEEMGGQWTASPAEVARKCDVVITVLPNEAALRAVFDGPDALDAPQKEGLVVVELCTLPIAVKQWAADRLAEAGGTMLDCPISGYPALVEARQAIIFISGDKEAAEAAGPVFDGCTDKHVYLGEFGTSSKLKFVANLLVGVHMVATAEALALAEKAGLDLPKTVEILSDSAAASNMLKNRAPVMRDRDFDTVRARVEVIHKDLKAISEFSHALGATTPLLDASFAAFGRAIDSGLAKKDMAAIFDVMAGRA